MSTLAPAAPTLGGFIYAVATDQAIGHRQARVLIARDANEQRETLAAGSEIGRTGELRPRVHARPGTTRPAILIAR